MSLAVHDKKLLARKIISLVDEILIKKVRAASKQGRSKKVEMKDARITGQDFLKGTENLVQYYQTKVTAFIWAGVKLWLATSTTAITPITTSTITPISQPLYYCPEYFSGY